MGYFLSHGNASETIGGVVNIFCKQINVSDECILIKLKKKNFEIPLGIIWE